MINLCFHGIGPPRRVLEPDEDGYWISVSLFNRVLDEVSGREDVTLSFDDGNESDHTIGLPALLERGASARFFVLAGRLDRTGSLSREALAELSARGMPVGNHGMTHRSWRALSPDERARELVAAREVLTEVVDSSIDEAAPPMGRYDRSVLRDLRTLGYRRVWSSDRRRAAADAWLQPRYSIRAADTIESVRRDILDPPRAARVVRSTLVGVVKRWR